MFGSLLVRLEAMLLLAVVADMMLDASSGSAVVPGILPLLLLLLLHLF